MASRVISAVLKLKDQNFGRGLVAATNRTNDLSRKVKYAGNNIKNFASSGVKSFGSLAKSAAGLAAGFVAFNGIKSLVGDSISTFKDFEKTMSDVKAVSGATGDEMLKLTEKAKQLNQTTKFTATEAGEGFKYLALAGYDVEQQLAAIDGLLDLAAAGNMELATATDIVTDVMSAFGMEASKAGHAADVFAYAQANANTNVEQIGEAMKYAAPTANQFGWSIEETSAAMMTLADSGLKGSIAGQAFASSLGRLADDSGAVAKKAKELGIEFFNAKGKMKSMPDLIAEIEKATNGMTDQKRAASLTKLFGAEAFKHWAILLERGSGNLAKMTNELENSDGAAKDMADTMMDNLAGSLDLMNSAISAVKMEVGEQFAPVIRKLADYITSKMPQVQSVTERALNKISDMKGNIIGMYEASKPGLSWMKDVAFPMLSDSIGFTVGKGKELYSLVKDNWSTIMPVVAGITASIAAYKIGIIAASIATKTWRTVTTATTIAMGLLNGTLALTPLGWIAIGIGAVVAASIVLYKNADKLKEGWNNAWSSIKTATANGVNSVIEKVNGLIDILNKIPGVNIPIVPKVQWGNASGQMAGESKVYSNASKSAQLASFDVGTNRVTHDQVAKIHKDEMIIPARQAQRVRSQGGTIDNIDKMASQPSIVTAQSTQANGDGKGEITVVIENITAAGVSVPEVVREIVTELKLQLANI